MDGGGKFRGHGNYFRGMGGILATSHLSRTGGCLADMAMDTTDPGGTFGRWALISFLEIPVHAGLDGF